MCVVKVIILGIWNSKEQKKWSFEEFVLHLFGHLCVMCSLIGVVANCFLFDWVLQYQHSFLWLVWECGTWYYWHGALLKMLAQVEKAILISFKRWFHWYKLHYMFLKGENIMVQSQSHVQNIGCRRHMEQPQS